MWRGSGSGELGSIVCQRAAGFSPLNYRSGMFPAADSPSAPTRVGASQAGEGAGAGAGPRPGDRARPGGGQQQETPPAVSAPGSWARAGISAPGAKLQPGPACSGCTRGQSSRWRWNVGLTCLVGGRPGPRGWPGLAAAVCPALPFLEGLALWCPLGWDNQHPSTRW